MDTRKMINNLMQSEGVSKKELSERLNMNYNTIHNMLYVDNKGLQMSRFKEILRVLGYEIKIVPKEVTDGGTE